MYTLIVAADAADRLPTMDHDTDRATAADSERLDLDDPEVAGQASPSALGGGAPDLAALLRTGEKWGYVDDDGNIHVRAGKHNEDRLVAHVPPSKRAETIAKLLLRFQELEDRFAELRKELRRSKNPARNLKSLRSFVHWVEGAEAIGDFDCLLGRAHVQIARIEHRLAEQQAAKLDLVERAEALTGSNRWKSTGEVMGELMQEWKRAGSAGRELDEALWHRFNEARRTFFHRRDAHFADLKKSRAEAREVKRSLIARAEELAPSTDFEKTSAEMQNLLEEWKRVGSAGRDIDDRLWEHFRTARDPFFERRKAHFSDQRRRGDRNRGRGPHGDGGRPPGGARPKRPRGGPPGVLRSSLADLVGPLRDLFPDEGDPDESEKTPATGKDKNGKG